MEGINYAISGKFQLLFPASIKEVGDQPQDSTYSPILPGTRRGIYYSGREAVIVYLLGKEDL